MVNNPQQIETINLAIKNLTERINSIENLDVKFLIPTLIAIISIIFSIYQVWFQNRRELLFNIEQNIDDARLLLTKESIKIKGSDETQEIKLAIIDTHLENLINKFDNGCRKYNQNKICRKEFKNKYNASIVKIFENHKHKFNDSTDFNNMLLYIKKNHLAQ